MPEHSSRQAALQALDSPRALLRARLKPPALPASTVTRVEINQRLEAAHDRCATLLRAPAGFGKTVAAADWVRGRNKPTAWLGLEATDNDPDEFLRYLMGAFISAGIPSDLHSAASILKTTAPDDHDARLHRFANLLVKDSSRHVMVLEHYDYIENPEIHRLIAFLLNQLQASLRIVFVSRTEPPIDIPRLRACGRLSEIRTSVFQFDDEEVRKLFELEAEVSLSHQEARFLQKKLMGWAAGLQSTAHEMRFRSDGGGLREAYQRALPSLESFALTQFLDYCSAGDVGILEKLAELGRIDPLAASIFAPEIRGRDLLSDFIAAGVPLQGSGSGTPGTSYTLHPILRGALRRKLRQESVADISELHRMAAEHFEARGEISQAAAHLLSSAIESRNRGERDAAYTLVERALQLGLQADLKPWAAAFFNSAGELIRDWINRGEFGVGEDHRRLLDYAESIVKDLTERFEDEPQSESPDALSEREQEVMDLLAEGRTSAAIADDLILSPHTVRTHVKNIYRKLRVHSRLEAVKRARELGLLP